MTENECEKCRKLNKKLGIENPKDYEAICDGCWDKRVDEYNAVDINCKGGNFND